MIGLQGRAAKRLGQPGWVYAIRIPRGPTKIGLTYGTDPRQRIYAIRKGSVNRNMVLVGVTYSLHPEELEQMLHRAFCHRRRSGTEWFDLVPSEVQRLKLIAHLHEPIDPPQPILDTQPAPKAAEEDDPRDIHSLLTRSQVAELFGVPQAWVDREVREGRMPSVTFVRIDPAELRTYLDQKRSASRKDDVES